MDFLEVLDQTRILATDELVISKAFLHELKSWVQDVVARENLKEVAEMLVNVADAHKEEAK